LALSLCVPFANLFDLARGQLGRVDGLASRVPTLCDLVAHVVERRSKEEMIGSNAGGNVALVANVHAIRDRPKVNFIRDAMRTALIDLSVSSG